MELMEFITVFFGMDPAGSNPLANLLMILTGAAAVGLVLVGMAGALMHERSSRAGVEQQITPDSRRKAA